MSKYRTEITMKLTIHCVIGAANGTAKPAPKTADTRGLGRSCSNAKVLILTVTNPTNTAVNKRRLDLMAEALRHQNTIMPAVSPVKIAGMKFWINAKAIAFQT